MRVPTNFYCAVDNAGAGFLGYRPKDSVEQYAARILAEAAVADSGDLSQTRHGGPFASTELGSSGLATMNIVNDSKTL